jgi:hypothetical protein
VNILKQYCQTEEHEIDDLPGTQGLPLNTMPYFKNLHRRIRNRMRRFQVPSDTEPLKEAALSAL